MDSHINVRTIPSRHVSLLLLVVALATTLVAANPGIAPPNSMPHGVSYARWGATWWQWAFALHANLPPNPLLTVGAVDCSYGQAGKVWFLAGALSSGSSSRSCQVPTGTWLFLPVLNAWSDNVAVSPPVTIATLQQQAAYYAEASELHASIDGVPVQNLFAYRAAYAPFAYTVTGPDGQVVDAAALTDRTSLPTIGSPVRSVVTGGSELVFAGADRL